MNIENKIIAYFEDQMKASERQELEHQIKNNEEYAAIFESYQQMYEVLEDPVMESPSPNLRKRFDAMMRAEMKENGRLRTVNEAMEKSPDEQKNSIRWLPIMGIAASIVLLFCVGYLIGENNFQQRKIDTQHAELAEVQKKMENLLATESVFDRIKAVNVSYELPAENQAIVDLLIQTLRKDESSHVRLAALEALQSYVFSDSLEDALIAQMKDEEDAHVRIALIKTLANNKSKEAEVEFDNIIQNEASPKYLKDEVHMAKLKLEQTNI